MSKTQTLDNLRKAEELISDEISDTQRSDVNEDLRLAREHLEDAIATLEEAA